MVPFAVVVVITSDRPMAYVPNRSNFGFIFFVTLPSSQSILKDSYFKHPDDGLLNED